jgi:hypothetical protein
VDIEYSEKGNPYAPPRPETGSRAPRPPDPDRAGAMLRQGIIGAVFLGFFPVVSFVLGIANWGRARADLDLMARGLLGTGGGASAKTKAGLILAKINTIVAPFALITLALYIWFLAESM